MVIEICVPFFFPQVLVLVPDEGSSAVIFLVALFFGTVPLVWVLVSLVMSYDTRSLLLNVFLLQHVVVLVPSSMKKSLLLLIGSFTMHFFLPLVLGRVFSGFLVVGGASSVGVGVTNTVDVNVTVGKLVRVKVMLSNGGLIKLEIEGVWDTN